MLVERIACAVAMATAVVPMSPVPAVARLPTTRCDVPQPSRAEVSVLVERIACAVAGDSGDCR